MNIDYLKTKLESKTRLPILEIVFHIFFFRKMRNKHLWYCLTSLTLFFLTICKYFRIYEFAVTKAFQKCIHNYNGRRIYQYNKDDFRFQFWFVAISVKQHELHLNIKVKRSCQLKKLVFDYLWTCNSKKACYQSEPK